MNNQRLFLNILFRYKIFLILVFLSCLTARGAEITQEAKASQEAKQETDRLLQMLNKVPEGGATGEQVAWNWNWFLSRLMKKCVDNPTDVWLDPTEKVLLTLTNKMATGPDGYKGFIGPYIYNAEYWTDVHVGDAILVSHLLTFAMLVHEHPKWQEKYGASAAKFVALAKKDLIEKWNKRGTYVQDGDFGGYHEWKMFCLPNDIQHWFSRLSGRPQNSPSPALPFNKALDMAYCMLQIYCITGEEPYKVQAEQIYNRFKAGLNRFEGGYTWNYWEPLSSQDILERNNNRYELTHWVGTHPYRDYQAGEMEKIVFAYHCGVTFTQADMERFVQTNLRFMWNGDLEKTEWANSDSKLPGYKKAAPSTTYPTTAGTVWSALKEFDPTILTLVLKKGAKEITPISSSSSDHGKSESFKRKYASQAVVEEFPWMNGVVESAGQTEALVIPSIVSAGSSTMILSKAIAPKSPCEIYVKPIQHDERTLLTTQMLGDGVQHFYSWDGTINGVRTPGKYVIIWKYRGGERAYPISLQ